MKTLYPKMLKAKGFYQVADLHRIFKIGKPLLRSYIANGIFKTDIESQGKRIPNLFNITNIIRIGLMKNLFNFGLSWKKASSLIYSIEEADLNELIDELTRYMIIRANNVGEFKTPNFVLSIEMNFELNDFDKDSRFLLIVDCEKVLQHIEAAI